MLNSAEEMDCHAFIRSPLAVGRAKFRIATNTLAKQCADKLACRDGDMAIGTGWSPRCANAAHPGQRYL